MIYLPDRISECVTAISTITNPVYFHFGSWNDLLIDLTEKKQSPTYQNLRFPLIFLHNKYKESASKIGKNQNIVDEAKIYIIVQSYIENLGISPDKYTIQQRLDSIYKLQIAPIYDLFIREMTLGAKFVSQFANIDNSHEAVFNLWVGDTKNKLTDFLDAVEITFKNLNYYTN